MKILYLFRDSYDAKYILSELAQKKVVSGFILEKGSRAKKNKLKRIFRRSSILQYLIKIIDLITLIIYSYVVISRMQKKLGKFRYPDNKLKLIVDDANDMACIEYIKEYKPDVLFIYGTAILSRKFLSNVTCPIFNIHSGILPRYRNVHSDFWAFINKDYKNIGITIIYLDEGIDSGDIALKKNISYEIGDSLVDIKIKNLKIIPTLITSLLNMHQLNKLKRIKQGKQKYFFYQTPTLKDLYYFIKNK